MDLTDKRLHFTDTHSHIYSAQFDTDRKEIMQRCEAADVEKIYLPAIDSSTHDAMLQVETDFPQCVAMMGVHPCSVTADYKNELAIAEKWLDKRSFVAIGEIGLDYYWSTEFEEQQADAFAVQMQWALDKQIPIVIHTRNAMQPTIDMVKPFADKGLRGIFHCFSGTADDAEQIVNMNFYLGIGGVLTYKKSGLPEALDKIPLDKIVLETDAPYLSPVPHRGKRNESSYLPLIAQKLSEIKNISLAEVAEKTAGNAEIIFTASV